MKRSTYYYVLKSLQKEDKYKEIRNEIRKIVKDNKGRYGYRRVTNSLKENYKINHKTVLKLMREEKLLCPIRPKKYKSYQGEVGTTAPNLLNRDFRALKPYEKLATDITEFRVKGQKLYGSAVIDMYNGEILCFDISKNPNLAQIKRTLKALESIIPKDANPTIHSDQGWQYRNYQYVETLKKNNWTQSMSRKGNCYDNSVIENFFGIIKSEFFYQEEFESVEEFIVGLREYLDYYNNKRIKLKLKTSPVEFRLKNCA